MKKIKAKSKQNKNTMVLWLSLALLAIVLEALYVMKFETQKSLQARNPGPQVSGVNTSR
jgi:hypothetical protein